LRHVEADVSVEASNGDDVRIVTRLDVDDGEFVLEADDFLLILVVTECADLQNPSAPRPRRHDREQIAAPQAIGPERPVLLIPSTDVDRERMRRIERVVVFHSLLPVLNQRLGTPSHLQPTARSWVVNPVAGRCFQAESLHEVADRPAVQRQRLVFVAWHAEGLRCVRADVECHEGAPQIAHDPVEKDVVRMAVLAGPPVAEEMVIVADDGLDGVLGLPERNRAAAVRQIRRGRVVRQVKREDVDLVPCPIATHLLHARRMIIEDQVADGPSILAVAEDVVVAEDEAIIGMRNHAQRSCHPAGSFLVDTDLLGNNNARNLLFHLERRIH
jgi:hypothetical protein